ncbi:MAG: glycosyl transferase family 39 [Prosthecobacter sp.]|nr:glycosyl transferase family 39 [Prosthecobacter sp.]
MASNLRLTRAAVLFACLLLASALPAADSPFAPDIQHRLDLLKTGYETFVLNNGTIPFEDGVKALNAKVKPTLERESAAAAQRTDLNALVRIKADLERLGKGAVLTAVEEPPPESLRHTYTAYKLALSRLESAQKASLADAKYRYDRGLELVQNELTKAQEVAAALQVKQLREALAAAAAPTAAAVAEKDAATSGSGNLLLNGTFEKGTKMWEFSTHEPASEASMTVDKKILYHEKPTLRVANPARTDTHISQTVKVRPGTRYHISGFIKAQDIKDAKGMAAGTPGVQVNGGGCLSVWGKERTRTSFVITDTWTAVSEEFTTKADETEIVFECRLGHFGSTCSGTAWFADLSLTEVKQPAPQTVAAAPGTVPRYWTYHMKETDQASLANITLMPDGRFTMSGNEPGKWEHSKSSGVITISFAHQPPWTMTLSPDGTATLDRPDVGRRYMRIRK